MGVAATLVASLVIGGRLWGLIACHHYAARAIHYSTRAACELLAEAVATRIAALESFAQNRAELTVRRLEQRLAEAVARDGDWRAALFDNPQALLEPLRAGGAALLFEDQVQTAGDVPSTAQLRRLGSWLDRQPKTALVATASLGLDEPQFVPLTTAASGLLAVPLSSVAGEYLIWLRPEQVHTVTWGGNPFKPVLIGDDPSELSPRRSFAQWQQLVEGTAEPWTPADLTAARLIGATLADVIHQFRSVRLLLAQHQLATLDKQLRASTQPVLIADARGQVLLTNGALKQLLSSGARLRRVVDLAALLSDPATARRRLLRLVRSQQPWRAEVALGGAAATPLLLRADPVSVDGRVLGFIVLLSDASDRKAAALARGRFQAEVIERRQMLPRQLDLAANQAYRELLGAVVDNAQLAALEITDGVDPEQIPPLLDGVQSSVSRAAELLEQLLRHGGGRP